MRIIFLPEVLGYFNELSTILYEKEYFGFEEDALRYVDDFGQHKTTLHTRTKTCPGIFQPVWERDVFFRFPKK